MYFYTLLFVLNVLCLFEREKSLEFVVGISVQISAICVFLLFFQQTCEVYMYNVHTCASTPNTLTIELSLFVNIEYGNGQSSLSQNNNHG